MLIIMSELFCYLNLLDNFGDVNDWISILYWDLMKQEVANGVGVIVEMIADKFFFFFFLLKNRFKMKN